MNSLPLHIIIPVGLFIFAIVVIGIWNKLDKPKTKARVESMLTAEGLLYLTDDSFFVGEKSRGKNQPKRGYGIFAVTEKRVFWMSLISHVVMEIPRHLVLEITAEQAFKTGRGITHKFIGKYGDRLLLVRFHDGTGNEDTWSWYVTDIDRVLELLTGEKQ